MKTISQQQVCLSQFGASKFIIIFNVNKLLHKHTRGKWRRRLHVSLFYLPRWCFSWSVKAQKWLTVLLNEESIIICVKLSFWGLVIISLMHLTASSRSFYPIFGCLIWRLKITKLGNQMYLSIPQIQSNQTLSLSGVKFKQTNKDMSHTQWVAKKGLNGPLCLRVWLFPALFLARPVCVCVCASVWCILLDHPSN